MSESADRATIEALVAALNAGDREALGRVFADDIVMTFPQSGERIVGNANRHEIYERMPSLPQVSVRALTGSGGSVGPRGRPRLRRRRPVHEHLRVPAT